MEEGILLILNDDGVAEEYDDAWVDKNLIGVM